MLITIPVTVQVTMLITIPVTVPVTVHVTIPITVPVTMLITIPVSIPVTIPATSLRLARLLSPNLRPNRRATIPLAPALTEAPALVDYSVPKERSAAAKYPAFKRYTPNARDAVRTSVEQSQPLTNSIWCGDCREVLRDKFPNDYFDLIVTSPPYAEARKRVYGGVHADRYAEWMLECTTEFLRVLKPSGTFVLNIKEKVIDGERHTYVIDLIKGMRSQGWRWTEELIWHKKNCYPGKWPNRFRDAWERLLQFNKTRDFKMRQEAVMVPMGDWREARLRNLSETDRRRDESRVLSGFGKNDPRWGNRKGLGEPV